MAGTSSTIREPLRPVGRGPCDTWADRMRSPCRENTMHSYLKSAILCSALALPLMLPAQERRDDQNRDQTRQENRDDQNRTQTNDRGVMKITLTGLMSGMPMSRTPTGDTFRSAIESIMSSRRQTEGNRTTTGSGARLTLTKTGDEKERELPVAGSGRSSGSLTQMSEAFRLAYCVRGRRRTKL
jgi:hypothetical protein